MHLSLRFGFLEMLFVVVVMSSLDSTAVVLPFLELVLRPSRCWRVVLRAVCAPYACWYFAFLLFLVQLILMFQMVEFVINWLPPYHAFATLLGCPLEFQRQGTLKTSLTHNLEAPHTLRSRHPPPQPPPQQQFRATTVRSAKGCDSTTKCA